MVNESTRQGLSELSNRAQAIKADPKLRHTPNVHDIFEAGENTRLMQTYQYQAIYLEGNDDR